MGVEGQHEWTEQVPPTTHRARAKPRQQPGAPMCSKGCGARHQNPPPPSPPLLSPAHRTHVPRLSGHEPSAHARTVAHAAGLRAQQSERVFSIPTLSPHVHGARMNTRTLATASLSFLATSLRACTMPRGLAYRET